jgi:hypothetical protein
MSIVLVSVDVSPDSILTVPYPKNILLVYVQIPDVVG